MWSVVSRCELHVGEQSVRWLASDGGVSCVSGSDWQDALARLEALPLKAGRRARLRVRLSGGLARPFMLPRTDGVAGVAEALALAQAMASDATGIGAEPHTVMQGWRADGDVLVTAVDRGLAPSLLAWADDHGLRVTSIEPWWADAFNQLLNRRVPMKSMVFEDQDSLLAFRTSGTTSGTTGGTIVSGALGYWPAPVGARRAAVLGRLAVAGGHAASEIDTARWNPDGEIVWQEAAP